MCVDSEVLSPRVPNQQLQQDIISLAELREAAALLRPYATSTNSCDCVSLFSS